MSLLSFCEWLASTRWSIDLHESLYMYPLIETTHVLSLLLFVGTVLFVDLRLLGWTLRDVPVSEVVGRIIPWAVAGFGIVSLTGFLLFYAIPVRTYLSIFFRIKMIMLVVAGVSVWTFHRYMNRTAAAWDRDPIPPPRARLAGAVSLLSWVTVIVTGRMIAYDWFDCDRGQSAFVSWAAGCPAELP
ncbi:MAG: hypothetical protein JRG95_11380 [Deltaproteobacteria bacterium]|nr:hypothetical protein [Deltaproteobacteria bacterium]